MQTTSVAPNTTASYQWEKPTALKSQKKKNNPLLIVAIVAVLVLCISGFYRATHQAAPSEWIKVVGAANDIPVGTKINFTSLRYIEVPKRFFTAEMSTSLPDVSGYFAKTFIPQGEPIRTNMVYKSRNGMSYMLENDERAITLQLDDDGLVDHEIIPDDRVDVLVISSKDGEKYTKTLCQNVRVLLAAPKSQTLKSGGNSVDRVTLAVGAGLAEDLAEASEIGKIRLTLRNRLARAEQHVSGVGPDDLLPSNAFKKTAVIAKEEKSAETQTAIIPPPPAASLAADADAPTAGPIQWIVEMFAGGKKESLAVPEQ